MSGSADLQAAVERWLREDPDGATRAELEALRAAGDWDEVGRRFDGRLSFGTAGLRAELGAGPQRMNRLVVRQSTAGLVAHVEAERRRSGRAGRGRLVVGFDARHGSAAFAGDVAACAAAAGFDVDRLDRPLPTPVLAYAVRALGADVGVMITASHNPGSDNGYKVYLADGAQIIPPHDVEIAAAIERAAAGPVAAADPAPPPCAPAASHDLVESYLDAVLAQCLDPAARQVSVAYTALYGVGGDVMARAAAHAGFERWTAVASQDRSDPNFGGLRFPNPEEPGVLDELVGLARRIGADVALANDPDADRLGVAVPSDSAAGGWRVLSGNEIGWLLADHILTHTTGADRLVVTTVVSSQLLGALAAAHGVQHRRTLTGFKWVVRAALAHPELRFVFGYEEALGYAVGPAVRDKDGIGAALVFAELTASLQAARTSVEDRLAELGRRFGHHRTAGWSFRLDSRDGAQERLGELTAALRRQPPARVGTARVLEVRDLALGLDGLEPTDALEWRLDERVRVIIRPSGTEPKLKVYAEAVADDPAEGDARLAELEPAMRSLLAL